MSQSLFYWIIYSYNRIQHYPRRGSQQSQSLFYWIIYSYDDNIVYYIDQTCGLNPYFTGLSILMHLNRERKCGDQKSQSLFYWIIYSYNNLFLLSFHLLLVSILILLDYLFLLCLYKVIYKVQLGLNPYFTGLSILIKFISFSMLNTIETVSILILLDYLFLLMQFMT